MYSMRWKLMLFSCSLALAGLTSIFLFGGGSATLAQNRPALVEEVRVIEAGETGVSNPAGLAFSAGARAFHVVAGREQNQPAPANLDVVKLDFFGDRIGSATINAAVEDPINIAFDDHRNRLLIFQSPDNYILEVQEDLGGDLDPGTLVRHDAGHFGLQDPQGMAVDPVNGDLFVLDGAGPRLVRVRPAADGTFAGAAVSAVDLQAAGLSDLRGMAFDPANGNLHLMSPGEQRLYELTQGGQIVAVRGLSGLNLRDPQGMVFAPSSDLTDDASVINLFIADSAPAAGGIVELSFTEPPLVSAVAVALVELPLVQTIDTSKFDPPSPDPSGVTYLPANDTLLIVDGEVNEMPIFTGANVFETTLQGTLVYTMSTISGAVSFSDEPSGLDINPANRHLFIADDTGTRSIYEWDPGPDGIYDTPDDIVTSFSTSDFDSKDPEGVTYATDGTGVLYIADGANSEVYRVDPGGDGIFNGVPPAGDDEVTSFDTLSLGLEDPEGIVFHPGNGHLYAIGKPNDTLFALTTEGALVQMIGVAAANARKPAGLALGPGSQNPAEMSIYIVDRGVDNNSDPDENDGKMYEFSFDPPKVTINAPAEGSSFSQGESIAFSGGASDEQDGNMAASLVWTSSIDGAIGAGGSFAKSDLSVGTHAITAMVTDSDGLIGQDLVNLTVIANNAPMVTISAPANGSSFNQEESVTFSGDASDPEDGDLTPNLAWTSSIDGAIGTGGGFSSSTLSVGTHTITATATDSGGASAQAQITINVTNRAPMVTISAPADGSSFNQGESVAFSGSAIDPENGDLTASLVWASSIDGDIGTGGGFSNSTLSVGTHIITATATDSGGLSAQDQITVNVTNRAPTVTITAPADGSSFDQGESIAFSGSAADPEDSDLTASLVWTSSIDGAIGVGGSFVRSDLSVGAHAITAAATDSGGLSAQAQVNLTVIINREPSVSISAPADDSSIDQDESIVFIGNATDLEDDDLTASLVWTSSIDGAIGAGGSFTRSDLSVGTHIITATVTDSGGLSAQAQVNLTVIINRAPSVSISAPAGGSNFNQGKSIVFIGNATDLEDDDLTADLAWTSSIDGDIGAGGSFARSDLSVGTHAITATATDSGDLTGQAQITLTVGDIPQLDLFLFLPIVTR